MQSYEVNRTSRLSQELVNKSFPSDLQWDLGKEQLHLSARSLGMFHLLN